MSANVPLEPIFQKFLLLMPPGAVFELSAHSCRQSLHDHSASIQPLLQITRWRGIGRLPARSASSISSSHKAPLPSAGVGIALPMLLAQKSPSERERLPWLKDITLNGVKKIIVMIDTSRSSEFRAGQISSLIAFTRATGPLLVSFITRERTGAGRATRAAVLGL